MTRTSVRTRLATALVGVALAATGLVTLGVGPAAASDGGMLSQVNASRDAKGLPAYRWNSHLASVAAGQAHRMATKRNLYHNPNLASEVGGYRWVGENVGYGPNASVIESAFMKSPAHRANILDDDYTQIGIASERDKNGRLWVAQVFREPIGGGSGGASTKKKSSTGSKPKANKPKASKPKTRTTTDKGDASAPEPEATPVASAEPDPKPAARPKRRTTPAPAPRPTLAQRVSYAQQLTPAGTDPVADALAFAATMQAVAG